MTFSPCIAPLNERNIVNVTIPLLFYQEDQYIIHHTTNVYLKFRLITDDIEPEPEEVLDSPVEGGLTDLNLLKLGFADAGKVAILLTTFSVDSS
jgi:hypothetical protein